MADGTVIQNGSFCTVTDTGSEYVLEDRTKRGLEVRERSADDALGTDAEKGMIHDMDGIGHLVPIRWHFAKDSFEIGQVLGHAEALEKKYAELREITCPDDQD